MVAYKPFCFCKISDYDMTHKLLAEKFSVSIKIAF